MDQHQEKHVGDHIISTPFYIFLIRIGQCFLSLIILGLAGGLMHDAYLDEHGLALAISLITWFVVAYIVLSEKLPVLHGLYNIIAVLVLDGLMVILWLATFAAVAAKRAKFVVDVSVSNCIDTGGLFNSKFCSRKRDLFKRGVILFKKGQSMMAANAGLGALVWLLFIATFAWTLYTFLQARKQGRFQNLGGIASNSETVQMEPKSEQQYQPVQQPIQPQPTAQSQYPQAQYPQGQYAQEPYNPQPQGGAYPPVHDQQQAYYPQQHQAQNVAYPTGQIYEAPTPTTSPSPHPQQPQAQPYQS